MRKTSHIIGFKLSQLLLCCNLPATIIRCANYLNLFPAVCYMQCEFIIFMVNTDLRLTEQKCALM